MRNSRLEWLTRPGSQELGAKWVKVTKRRAQDSRLIGWSKANLKTWPATPVEGFAQNQPVSFVLHFVEVAPSQ